MFALAKAARQRGPTTVGRCCCAALIGVLSITIFSQAAAPEIESISPHAINPGVPVEVTFSGSGLSEATNVWASFPAKFESLGEGRFRVNSPADWPVGIAAVRLYGANGVSPLGFVMIDDLPTVPESQTNKTRATAQRIKPGSAVEGRCEELSYDWFVVPARKGQRIALEVVANRVGSRLDSVLRVFDGAGKQMAQNDDAPGLRGDSYLQFTAAKDGHYFVELRDINYSGSSETFYWLRVGDFALATTAYPPAIVQGEKSVFQLSGPAGEVGRTEWQATNSGFIPVAVRGAKGSTFAKALVSSGREIVEREPNDVATKATTFSTSDGLNGRFEKAGDRDWYEFMARKGERLEFSAASRSLGAPCDVALEIFFADGKTLARSNPTAADEGVVTHKFTNDGPHRLLVEEVTGTYGANCVYRVTVQPAAGFALALDTDRFNVAAGKSFDLKVSITRGEYKGAVTLALEGIESLLWTNNVIAEGKSNATMKVTVPANLPAGAPRFFSVVGTARRDGSDVRVRASTAPALRRRFPQMLYAPPEFDGEIVLGLTSE